MNDIIDIKETLEQETNVEEQSESKIKEQSNEQQESNVEEQQNNEQENKEQQSNEEENMIICKINRNKRLKYLQQRVKLLLKKPQPEQRSPEWFFTRNTIITASEAASCLTMSKKVCENYVNIYNIKNFKYNDTKSTNAYDKLEEYIIKKCKAFNGENVFFDSVYTLWGKKYEDVALNLYKKIKNTEVYNFGLLKHPYLNWLGASPDGITKDGVMLEIKCPLSRKITGIPPLYYYIQVQIQLECAFLESADFLECEIKELSLEEYNNTDESENKGVLINKINQPDNSEIKYIYQDAIDRMNPVEWASLKSKELQEDYEYIYYKIPKYNIVNIKRDKEWFNNVKDDLKRVHDIIRLYQNNKQEYNIFYEKFQQQKNKKHIENMNKSICLLD